MRQIKEKYGTKMVSFYEHPLKWLDAWVLEPVEPGCDEVLKSMMRMMTSMIVGIGAGTALIMFVCAVLSFLWNTIGAWLVLAIAAWLLWRFWKWVSS